MAKRLSTQSNTDPGKTKIQSQNASCPVSPVAFLNMAFGALLVISFFYGALFIVARRAIYSQNVTPLALNASLDRFSEGRAMKHIWYLAGEIGVRQEGSVGLIKAAEYLKSEVKDYKQRSSTSLRVEVDETFVNGSFNMKFLGHSIALAYRNHSNIAVRISAADADDNSASVLVNGHFDSALGSPGAGDCASCVAAMLEAIRWIVDTDWVPPNPIIFLFNGAEELFMLACHGFMTTHKWRSSLGALINLEGSGTSGPDLVCQSGPGSWPAQVYAKSAVYPMANTAAQDVFPLIPGDTDYRMFSEDYGDVPGLDIILVLQGYVYHTAYDTPEKMVPGSMQVRGENLINLLKAFTNSSELKNAQERAQTKQERSGEVHERRPVFFDFLGWFMVYYSHKAAMALHLLPLGFLFLIPSLTSSDASGSDQVSERFYLIAKGAVFQAISLLLAVVCPVVLAVLRLSISSTAMTWFAQPWMAFLMFGPAALVGLLLPRATCWDASKTMRGTMLDENKQKTSDWRFHWGAVAFYAVATAAGTYIGFANGFLSFWWSIFIMLSYHIFRKLCGIFGRYSLLSLLSYLVPLAPPSLFSLYFGGIFWQVVVEKMGMSGSLPQPYGFFVADVIMAATTGFVVALCIGPMLPIAGSWLASSHLIRFLVYLSIGSAAISSQFFPYSAVAPKRVVLQHTFQTTGGHHIFDSSYDFAVVDSNPLSFLFKNVPVAVERLNIDPVFREKTATRSNSGTWMAMYPVSYLFPQSFRFPAQSNETLKIHPSLPNLALHKAEERLPSTRRVYIELDLGSLKEVWAAVLNVTGPLVSWSFSNQQLPAPEKVDGGPPSYICRLSGRSIGENWTFWLEGRGSDDLRVDLAVLDQQMETETQKLINVFPPWVAITAASGYMSSYLF